MIIGNATAQGDLFHPFPFSRMKGELCDSPGEVVLEGSGNIPDYPAYPLPVLPASGQMLSAGVNGSKVSHTHSAL